MRTNVFLDHLVDEVPPFANGALPDPTQYSYYKAQTSFWFLSAQSNMEDSPQVDLTQTCSENEVITPDTLHKTLWFYRSSTNELLIPIKNARAILTYLYRALPLTITDDVAKSWLRTLEFSKRHKHTRTESLYKGVKFENCEPFIKSAERCVVLDMNQPDMADLTQHEMWAMMDMSKAGDPAYALPYKLKERRQANSHLTPTQLDALTAQSNPSTASKLNTARARAARTQHLLRLKKKYGTNTPEYDEAVAAYDRGERKPVGRQPTADTTLPQRTQLKVCDYIRELAHPEVNLFYGDLISVRGEGSLEPSDAPIVDQRALTSPLRFHTVNTQADYNHDNPPLGWVLDSREVRVPQGTNPQGETYYAVKTQVTRVALREPALQQRMANYSQAYHYVTTRRERNPVTGHNEMCAVFDVDHINTGKMRRRSPEKKENQLDGLTARVEELATKVDKLGKAFHALMGIIKELEERVSPNVEDGGLSSAGGDDA